MYSYLMLGSSLLCFYFFYCDVYVAILLNSVQYFAINRNYAESVIYDFIHVYTGHCMHKNKQLLERLFYYGILVNLPKTLYFMNVILEYILIALLQFP